MNPLRMHRLLGLVGCGLLAWFGLTGAVPSSPKTDTVTVSVRDNPTSYRPSYVGFYGFSRPSSGSGGGYRVGK
jgi:hypothetical protein